MPKCLCLLLAATLSVGCAAPRGARHVRLDSLSCSNVRHDSVYVYRDRLCDRTRDTVYLTDVREEYRYRLLHDTVRIVRVDTVPVVKEVESVRHVARPLSLFDRLTRVCFWILVGIIVLRLTKSQK